jgi:hypothetical protein
MWDIVAVRCLAVLFEPENILLDLYPFQQTKMVYKRLKRTSHLLIECNVKSV